METPRDKKRSRITQACDHCRQKKLKCQFKHGEPCFNCVAYSTDCTFNKSIRKRGPSKRHADEMLVRVREMERMIRDLTGDSNIDDLLETVQLDEDLPISKRKTSLTACSIQADNTKKSQNDVDFTDADSQRLLHTLLRTKTFGDLLRLHLRGISSKQPSTLNDYVLKVAGVDQYTCTRLLKIYFSNVHPMLPIVDKHGFLKQFRGHGDAYPPAALLNAMLGAAARFVECENLEPERKKHLPRDAQWDLPLGWSDHFFDKAHQLVDDTGNRSTLPTIQARVLIQNQRGHVDSKSSACWLMGCQTARMAQALGLHRNCDHLKLSKHEKEVRKRTFWALYISDRFQAGLNGRPMAILDEDVDVSLPDAEAHWREIFDEPDDYPLDPGPRFPSATHKPSSMPAHGRLVIYLLFIEFIKLSEIFGRIQHGIYCPRAQQLSSEQGSDTIVSQLDSELTQWRLAFPRAIKQTNITDFDEETGYFAPVIASVLLYYFSSLILLHRPFITQRTDHDMNPLPSPSFWICTSAATLGMRIAAPMTVHDIFLCPFATTFYPVLQCCLIHMYNTKHSDPYISAAAKAELENGIRLLNRFKGASSTGDTLRTLLHNVMNNKNIDVRATSEEQDAPYAWIVKSRKNGKTIPMRLSGNTPMSSLLEALALEPDSKHVLQMTEASTQGMSGLEEAFTLQQFGFDSSTSTDQDALFNTLMPTWAELSEPDVTTMISAPYTMADAPILAVPQPAVSDIGPLGLGGQHQHQNNLFRNLPDNPFWGLPSSIDWAEWDEWYQQNQNWGPLRPSPRP
ncbi:fungal-specific transcription factor domain-domain-containing protein [Syncephalastrum racemosum]|uniref:Fungal-specific transcription factor domain-domain-containing protein n=1 Tax=Syncephalastrum racemosum TaxID=13706 RepID=A0A1X2HE94_SYNRA|nr:fungal-specific transcription factor domain-domain-containing protein [Syncephalastrum racemosum]